MRRSLYDSGRASSRTKAGVGTLLAAAIVAGCTSGDGTPAGVQPTLQRTGPTVLVTPSIPPLVARVPVSSDPSPLRETAVQRLSNSIDAALTQTGRVTPATRMSQKAAAGDQVLIRWTVGLTVPDPGARLRVRTDAIRILGLVKASKLEYGSVLLLATGAAVIKGKKTVSIVVRAKYSKRLVRTTDWTKVSPTMILKMPDDKPAVIAPGYR